MYKLIILVVGCIYVATALGERLECFHCYESYNDTLSLRSSERGNGYGDRFVRCDKNKILWNKWFCPAHFPVCVIMSGRVKNHIEILRSCGERDFCNNYKPPPGVKLETCRECNTALCNEYLELPNPPVPTRPPAPTRPPVPEPSPPVKPNFFFNIKANINVNVEKHPRIDNKFLL